MYISIFVYIVNYMLSIYKHCIRLLQQMILWDPGSRCSAPRSNGGVFLDGQ